VGRRKCHDACAPTRKAIIGLRDSRNVEPLLLCNASMGVVGNCLPGLCANRTRLTRYNRGLSLDLGLEPLFVITPSQQPESEQCRSRIFPQGVC
jgi:hypothetical protein